MFVYTLIKKIKKDKEEKKATKVCSIQSGIHLSLLTFLSRPLLLYLSLPDLPSRSKGSWIS